MKRFLVKIISGFIPSSRLRKKFRAKFAPGYVDSRLGKASYVGGGFTCPDKDSRIGKFTSIAQNVCIGTTQHPTNWLSTSPFQYLPTHRGFKSEKVLPYKVSIPVMIGNDVWVGNNVVVMDGLTVADGAILASGAVVTKDVPPYAIVGGVPAKVIKYRFDKETICNLLELKWWDLEDDLIADLTFDDINKCIEELKIIRAKE